MCVINVGRGSFCLPYMSQGSRSGFVGWGAGESLFLFTPVVDVHHSIDGHIEIPQTTGEALVPSSNVQCRAM